MGVFVRGVGDEWGEAGRVVERPRQESNLWPTA